MALKSIQQQVSKKFATEELPGCSFFPTEHLVCLIPHSLSLDSTCSHLTSETIWDNAHKSSGRHSLSSRHHQDHSESSLFKEDSDCHPTGCIRRYRDVTAMESPNLCLAIGAFVDHMASCQVGAALDESYKLYLADDSSILLEEAEEQKMNTTDIRLAEDRQQVPVSVVADEEEPRDNIYDDVDDDDDIRQMDQQNQNREEQKGTRITMITQVVVSDPESSSQEEAGVHKNRLPAIQSQPSNTLTSKSCLKKNKQQNSKNATLPRKTILSWLVPRKRHHDHAVVVVLKG